MSMNLSDIAQKLGCRLDGPGETAIHGIAGIEQAEPGQITFLANRRYFPLLKTTRASAVLVEEGISLERDASLPRLAALRTANPYLAFAHAIELFYQAPRYAPGFHPTALIAKSAKIGAGAHIGPYCVVEEGAHIGRNAVLHSFRYHLPGRSHWRRLLCAFARRSARILPHWRPRHFAKRSDHRRRRPRLRKTERRHMVQDAAVRSRCS